MVNCLRFQIYYANQFHQRTVEDLIKVVDAGSFVYGILGDNIEDIYKKQSKTIDQLREYLLGYATDFGMINATEKFMGQTIMSEDFSEELQEAIDDYDDITFWFELEMRLGKRDFERTVTEVEKREMARDHGIYPKRIHALYEQWNKEFEGHGIERLEIRKQELLPPSI